MKMRPSLIAGAILLLLHCAGHAAPDLEVFQDLEEITSRIPRLKEKPFEKLIDENGFYQPEITIFNDIETGAEVWSVTREECKHLANIERRCAWSWNGQYVSFIGNRTFRDADGALQAGGGKWSGHNYLANADFSKGRKFFADVDGDLQILNDKFVTCERSDRPVVSFAVNDKLWRVTIGPGLADNRAEAVHTFPNDKRKILQTISDDNKLCIQDWNGKSMDDMPNYYIVDLSREPGENGFVRTHTLGYGGMTGIEGHDPQNEYRVHGISISRDGKKVSWGYGSMTSPGERVGFSVPANDLDTTPTLRGQKQDEWDQYRSHPGRSRDGRAVYFSGGTDKITAAGGQRGWGLWVHVPGTVPVFTERPCAGGHATWCGTDPDWWFANTSDAKQDWVDKTVTNRIVAGTPDGKLIILCRPWDRRRGGDSGYDGIPRPNQSPDATKCWFHSSMLMSSDESTGSYIVVHRRPYPPTSFTAAPAPGGLALTWQLPPVSNEVRGVNVYRKGFATDGEWRQLNDDPLPGAELILRDHPPGRYQFMATCEEWSRLESDTTSPLLSVNVTNTAVRGGPTSALGLTGWDKTPPAPVRGFRAEQAADGQIKLSWQPNAEPDLRHYNIYASSSGRPEPIQKRLLVSPPRGETHYLDWTAPKGQPITYCIVAIDRQGNTSEPAWTD